MGKKFLLVAVFSMTLSGCVFLLIPAIKKTLDLPVKNIGKALTYSEIDKKSVIDIKTRKEGTFGRTRSLSLFPESKTFSLLARSEWPPFDLQNWIVGTYELTKDKLVLVVQYQRKTVVNNEGDEGQRLEDHDYRKQPLTLTYTILNYDDQHIKLADLTSSSELVAKKVNYSSFYFEHFKKIADTGFFFTGKTSENEKLELYSSIAMMCEVPETPFPDTMNLVKED